MLESQAPFHEIRRVKFAVGYGASLRPAEDTPGICLRRGAGKLALREILR